MVLPIYLEAQITFNNEDSLFSLLRCNNVTAKINNLQETQAIATRNAAIANILNFRNPLNFSATNNLQLPVNFIPAEAFGGPAGSLKQITLGQQYVSNFNLTPQIDLINPQSWSKYKSAELNIESTKLNNQLTLRNVFETAALAFYNIASLEEQIATTTGMLQGAQTIETIVSQKYANGISRSQEVNNAKATVMSLKDRIAQLTYLKLQQETALKNLCNIPSSQSITIQWAPIEALPAPQVPQSNLIARHAEIQSRMAFSELRAARMAMLPVVSLVYYQGWQKNSNLSFTDQNNNWILNKYIGLKISLPFPPDVSRITTSYTSKINSQIANLNALQSKQQNESNNQLLLNEFNRQRVAWESAKEMAQLRKNNYESTLQQFNEGLAGADLMTAALNDYLNAMASLSNAQANLLFSLSKIKINNLIQ